VGALEGDPSIILWERVCHGMKIWIEILRVLEGWHGGAMVI